MYIKIRAVKSIRKRDFCSSHYVLDGFLLNFFATNY